jgi:hypothetical protein
MMLLMQNPLVDDGAVVVTYLLPEEVRRIVCRESRVRERRIDTELAILATGVVLATRRFCRGCGKLIQRKFRVLAGAQGSRQN